MALPVEDLDPEETSGDLVTWMAPGAIRLGAAGVAVVVLGAFALGLAAAVALFSLAREAPAVRRHTVH